MRSRSDAALAGLVGKIVSGIVITQNEQGNPRSQIFVTFSDGTSFEFWTGQEVICTATGLDHQCLDDIVDIQDRREGTQIITFRPPHQDPSNLQRDLLDKSNE